MKNPPARNIEIIALAVITALVLFASVAAAEAGDVRLRFKSVSRIRDSQTIGADGKLVLAIHNKSGELAQIISAQWPSTPPLPATGVSYVTLSSDSRLVESDARRIFQQCERLALVAQLDPSRYDLIVRILVTNVSSDILIEDTSLFAYLKDGSFVSCDLLPGDE